MKDINTTYLERYRRRLADLNAVEQEIQSIRERYDKELSDIASRKLRVTNEIAEMRKIITTMVDHGVDPVEAKLRNENSRNTIWDTGPSGEIGGGISIALDPVYSIGSISSIDLSNSGNDMSISLDDGYDYDNGGLNNGYPYR